MSLFVGCVFGFGVSIFFKKFTSLNEYPVRETGIILLAGYFSYLTAEIFNLSGNFYLILLN